MKDDELLNFFDSSIDIYSSSIEPNVRIIYGEILSEKMIGSIMELVRAVYAGGYRQACDDIAAGVFK